jgi:multiple sugar transport system permease protein
LGGALAWAVFPIAFLVLSSLKMPRDIFASPPRILVVPTLVNYHNLFGEHPELLTAFINSGVITALATLVALAVSFPAGYVFSRYQSKLLRWTAFFTVAIRMLPPIIITIPLFPLFHALGLFDLHATVAILYAAFFASLLTWIMKAFIDTVPREIEEAAVIDGATKFQVLTKIVLPLSKLGIFTGSVFVIIFSWNEFLFALLFTGTNSRTAPIVLSELLGGAYGAEWGMVFAASVVQLIPILLFTWATSGLLQRGLTLGAVK